VNTAKATDIIKRKVRVNESNAKKIPVSVYVQLSCLLNGEHRIEYYVPYFACEGKSE
jgi:hypothetical protein